MKKAILLIMVGMFLFTSCEEFLPYEDGEFEDEYSEGSSGQDAEGEDGDLTLYSVQGNSITKIKDFDTKKKYLDMQADAQLHEDAWEYVTTMIPEIYRDKISQYQVFHGEGELLGFVEPVDHSDLSKWKFALGIDQATGLNTVDFSNDFVFTIIHEYGHVLTLNDEQVDSVDEGQCNNYFTGEGCAKSNAYINKIVQIGWADILDEIGSQDLYEKYPDRFSTEYASTNPGEDVAEVFTLFVILDSKPTGKRIADKKIQAMYDFPDLVRLRNDIRSSVGPVKMSKLNLEGYKKVLPMLHKGHNH